MSSPSLKRWRVWCQRHWRWGLPGDCRGLGSASQCSKGTNKCFLMSRLLFPVEFFKEAWQQLYIYLCCCVKSWMQSHQVIGIINCDLSDGGAARVRQVGVTVVDRESAETYMGVWWIIHTVFCLLSSSFLFSFFCLTHLFDQSCH